MENELVRIVKRLPFIRPRTLTILKLVTGSHGHRGRWQKVQTFTLFPNSNIKTEEDLIYFITLNFCLRGWGFGTYRLLTVMRHSKKNKSTLKWLARYYISSTRWKREVGTVAPLFKSIKPINMFHSLRLNLE